MEHFLFSDLLAIFGFAIVILLLSFYLKIPPIVGFLITGVLAGPHGLALVSDLSLIEALAQVGIILLLFTIGMEFSLSKLQQMKKLFLVGGTFQVLLTILFTFIFCYIIGRTTSEALFFGWLVSMSSTAIIISLLDQKGESSTPHGKSSIAILIFQDMIAIPMVMLTPLLSVHQLADNNTSFLNLFLKGALVLSLVFFSAQKVVPKVLHSVAKTRNKELFLLTVLTLCFGVAWLTAAIGLSITIGAFLAGLILSDSDFNSEAVSHIFPLQALFVSFFFVSVGMLLDLKFVINNFWLVVALASAAIMIKTSAALITGLLLKLSLRSAFIVALTLAQIGEFAFVLAKVGIISGVMAESDYQLFLSVALMSLLISPFIIQYASQISFLLFKLPYFRSLNSYMSAGPENSRLLENHVVIVGFGVSGKHLANSAKIANIPYVVLETNPETVKQQKRNLEPIFFGDCSQEVNLRHLRLENAKALAIMINDNLAAKQAVKIAREINPQLYIIVRTRFLTEVAMMHHLGADEVIPDELGTSIEIFSKVLRQYHIPDDDISDCIEKIRTDSYSIFRNDTKKPYRLSDVKLELSKMDVANIRIEAGSEFVGKSLLESNLRKNFGVTVLLIKRGQEVINNPQATDYLKENDILVLTGSTQSFQSLKKLFKNEASQILAPVN